MIRPDHSKKASRIRSYFRLTYLIFLFFLAALFAAPTCRAMTAKEVIRKTDEIIQGKTQISVVAVTVKTRRWTRTMKMKSWIVRRGRKTFAEIYEPKKDAGNRFLLIGDRMWHYIPKLQQTIRISPSMMLQSWMGSDFTNDDIVKESSIIEDYEHKFLEDVTIDGNDCYKILLTPRPESAVVWGKILYYVRKADFLPAREEFFNEHDEMKKRMEFSNFKKMHDRVVPTLYTMRTIRKKDRYTAMEIKAIKYDQPISEGIFSLQNLKKK